MRNELLSIGEVSKMKGVSAKSLRYYESIGILRPARVDERSGYRYYSMNQLMDLDVIITCIELGIPLKELAAYMDEGGVLDLAALLERGREIAERNLHQAEAALSQVDACLDEMQAQRLLARSEGIYERTLPERLVLCIPWKEARFNAKRYASVMTSLYSQVKDAGLVPLYFQGMAFLRISPKSGFSWHAFVAAVRPRRIPLPVARHAVAQAGQGRLAAIPGGVFDGMRVVKPGFKECFEAVFAHASETGERTLVATETWDVKQHADAYVVEVLARHEHEAAPPASVPPDAHRERTA